MSFAKTKCGKGKGLPPIVLTVLMAAALLLLQVYPAGADAEGDDPSGAVPITPGVETQGVLETENDVDFFKFTAQAGTTYKMETLLEPSTLDDSILTLYDSDGVTKLAGNDDCQPGRLTSDYLRSCMAYEFPAEGTYFLEVTSWAMCCSFSYGVLVTQVSPYADDHGNNPALATAIQPDQQVLGSIEVPEDVDYFSFTARAGQRFHAKVTLGTLDDSILTLLDRDGATILRMNDDCGEAGDYSSCLNHTFQADGTYYLTVVSYGLLPPTTSGDPGDYSLLLEEVCLTCVVEAQGMVFLPNPVVKLQNTALLDDNDADSALLNDARVPVTFNIFEPADPGVFMLDGPFATTQKTAGRAQESSPVFSYTRADDRFEEVMAYYHIDSMQRYIQDTLGFTNVVNRSIPINVNGVTDDNSFYDPSDGSMTFGSGGVDDAEDAEIIAHEYGHAIQDSQVPFFGISSEGGAMGEGFGDYWAASFFTPVSSGFQDECVGEWDAVELGGPCLRRVDGTKLYSEVTGDVHSDGEIWSATLWEIRNVAGREDTDRMVIQSHFYLDSLSTFRDGALALIQADADLYRGLYECVVKDAFIRRGILDSASAPCVNKLHAPAGKTGKIDEARVPVDIIISTDGQVGSISFTLSYDQTLITPSASPACETSALTSGWTMDNCDTSQAGLLVVSLHDPAAAGIPPLTQGIVATLYFDVSGGAQADQQTALTFSNITITAPGGEVLSASSNDGDLTAVLPCSACDADGDGQVTVADIILMLNMSLDSALAPSSGSFEFQCLDKNSDSEVNILDAIGCLQAITGFN